jgi:hypothetical protein
MNTALNSRRFVIGGSREHLHSVVERAGAQTVDEEEVSDVHVFRRDENSQELMGRGSCSGDRRTCLPARPPRVCAREFWNRFSDWEDGQLQAACRARARTGSLPPKQDETDRLVQVF